MMMMMWGIIIPLVLTLRDEGLGVEVSTLRQRLVVIIQQVVPQEVEVGFVRRELIHGVVRGHEGLRYDLRRALVDVHQLLRLRARHVLAHHLDAVRAKQQRLLARQATLR